MLLFWLGVAAFALTILISVSLHEAGHMITAKRSGMKVTRYFVGFGPTIFSFQRGETEYGLKAIPLGGFCKIVGMTPQDDDVEAQDQPRARGRVPGGGGGALPGVEADDRDGGGLGAALPPGDRRPLVRRGLRGPAQPGPAAD